MVKPRKQNGKVVRKQADCPHCGRCPNCGRSDFQPYVPPVVIYPQPVIAPVYPQPWQPWVPQTIPWQPYWGGTTTICSNENPLVSTSEVHMNAADMRNASYCIGMA